MGGQKMNGIKSRSYPEDFASIFAGVAGYLWLYIVSKPGENEA